MSEKSLKFHFTPEIFRKFSAPNFFSICNFFRAFVYKRFQKRNLDQTLFLGCRELHVPPKHLLFIVQCKSDSQIWKKNYEFPLNTYFP